MATADALVNRVFRDYLTPMDEQPVTTRLSSAIDATAPSFTIDQTVLAPEERSLLYPGQIVELEYEQCRITAFDPSLGTGTWQRGVFGTTAIAHAATAAVYIAPIYTRQAVFEAMCDSIRSLWPDLSSRSVVTTDQAQPFVDLPANTEAVLSVRANDSNVVWALVSYWEFLRDHPASATGRSVAVLDVGPATQCVVSVRTKPLAPTSPTDDLEDLGVEPHWHPVIIADILTAMLASREASTATTEFITEGLEREGFPVGSGTQVARILRDWRDTHLERAKRQKVATEEVVIVQTPVF